MRSGLLSRRAVLRLGALAAVAGLVMATDQFVYAQGPRPAPAQIPRPPASINSSADITPQGVWRWQRSEYADGRTTAAPDPGKYTIALPPDAALGIQADCNRGSGRYIVDGPRLTLQPGPITLAACPPGSQAEVFLRDLRQVASYVFDGENLVLNLGAHSGNMAFSPQLPVTVTGAAWRVNGVNNGRGGIASIRPDTRLSVAFGDDGIVTGETGCNTLRGTYTLDGATISFGPIVTTRRACLSEQASTQEQAFLAALAAAARYELSGDRLTLRNLDGATQVTLAR